MLTRMLAVGTAIGVAGGMAASRASRWWKTWGVDPAEAGRELPGDDVVGNPIAIETRGITIDAPPDAVWPWLVQMGYGRAGWYSYDQLDQRGSSSESIVDAWQTPAVGDTLPTHPGGGFEVAILDPGHALVVRLDTALVAAQAETARSAGSAGPGSPQGPTAGVQASAAILGATPREFSASWAFVIEPVGDRQSRLLERFRIWFKDTGRGSRRLMGLLGFGVFVMMQRQMEGIRKRAETLAQAGPVTSPGAEPAGVAKPSEVLQPA